MMKSGWIQRNASVGFFALIAITTVAMTMAILASWLLRFPPIPALTDLAMTAETGQQVAAYRQLVDIHQERHREIFQLVTINTLLPVVTAVGGYVFGTRQRGLHSVSVGAGIGVTSAAKPVPDKERT